MPGKGIQLHPKEKIHRDKRQMEDIRIDGLPVRYTIGDNNE
jgi:hypothetical protein